MWHALRLGGINVGHERTARLMRLASLSDKDKGGAPVATRKPKYPHLRTDLANREFNATGPGQLRVADM